MTKEETAWLAGLLEGEACFDYIKDNKDYPRIRIEMADEDIIRRVRSLIGGRLYERVGKKKEHSKTFRLTLCEREAVNSVLKAVLPWLGERRRKKVQEQLDWFEANPRKGSNRNVGRKASKKARANQSRAMRDSWARRKLKQNEGV